MVFVKAMNPWDMQHDVPLAPHTTLEVGGQAQHFVSVTDLAWLPELLRWAQSRAVPVAILGGGSNLVVSDQGFRGLVLHLTASNAADAVRLTTETGHIRVQASAQVRWDALVAATCEAGSFDLVCLSGIPGATGAAPVQNIGAYGQSLSDCLTSVDGVDMQTGQTHSWDAGELGLGYRTSYFKTAWQARFAITQLHLRLRHGADFVPAYPQLTEALAKAYGPGPYTPALVRECVLALRASKSMVWDQLDPNRRSVGSFFTNPIVKTPHAQALCARYPAMPTWPQGAYTKLSAAWLIEQAGFTKGFRQGAVGVSSRHTLAVINAGGACAQDIVELGHVIQKSVVQTFGVGLAAEPSFWGFGPSHPLPAPAHKAAWLAEEAV